MGEHCRYLKTDSGHLGTEGTYGLHHQPADQHTGSARLKSQEAGVLLAARTSSARRSVAPH